VLGPLCGSNDFQDYFDDAKESRVKQVPKNQESKSFKNQVSRIKIQEQSSFKNQDSRTIKIKINFKIQEKKSRRFKIQEKLISRFKRRNREATVKTSQGKYFSKIPT